MLIHGAMAVFLLVPLSLLVLLLFDVIQPGAERSRLLVGLLLGGVACFVAGMWKTFLVVFDGIAKKQLALLDPGDE